MQLPFLGMILKFFAVVEVGLLHFTTIYTQLSLLPHHFEIGSFKLCFTIPTFRSVIPVVYLRTK